MFNAIRLRLRFQEIPFWHTLAFPTVAVWKLFFPSCLRGIIVPSPFQLPGKLGVSPSPSAFPRILLKKGSLLFFALKRGKTPFPYPQIYSFISLRFLKKKHASFLNLAATTTFSFKHHLFSL